MAEDAARESSVDTEFDMVQAHSMFVDAIKAGDTTYIESILGELCLSNAIVVLHGHGLLAFSSCGCSAPTKSCWIRCRRHWQRNGRSYRHPGHCLRLNINLYVGHGQAQRHCIQSKELRCCSRPNSSDAL